MQLHKYSSDDGTLLVRQRRKFNLIFHSIYIFILQRNLFVDSVGFKRKSYLRIWHYCEIF